MLGGIYGANFTFGNRAAKKRRRVPAGVAIARPIYLALTREEWEQLNEMAGRSKKKRGAAVTSMVREVLRDDREQQEE